MMSEEEIWKDVKGYEGLYQISNYGRVKNKKTDYILKPALGSWGYEFVQLCDKGRETSKCIHRMVAESFLDNPDNLPQVNHIDGNKRNNHIDNLEWVSCSQNIKHAFNTGLKKKKMGKENPLYGRCGIESTRHREVNKYDLEGNFIESYISIREASKKNNINASNISSVCSGRKKMAGNYIWKYKGDNK